MRSGIATHVLLQEKLWDIKSEPLEYQRARLLNCGSPLALGETILEEHASIGEGLTDRFVAHFHFCSLVIMSEQNVENLRVVDHPKEADVENFVDNSDCLKDAHLYEKMKQKPATWLVLRSLHGEHGQTLGASIKQGFDGFRSWLCSIYLWDSSVVLNAHSNLAEIKQSLEVILDRNADNKCSTYVALKFIVGALKLLHTKRKQDRRWTIGILLPLNCGHNGWLSDEEANNYAEWIRDLRIS